MLGEELHSFTSSGASCGRDVDCIASIVSRSTTNVEALLPMGSPSASFACLLMEEYFGAKWCQGFLVRIVDTMEDCVSR